MILLNSNKRKRIFKKNNFQEVKVLSTFKDFFNLVLIWSLLTSAAPFMFFLAIKGHPYKIAIAGGLLIASSLLLIKYKIKVPDKIIVLILISQIVLLVIPFSLFHREIHQLAYLTISIQYIAILILYLYVCNFYCFHKTAKSFLYVMVIMGICATIAFFLGLLGQIKIFSTHENPDMRTGYNFLLTYSNSIIIFGKIIIIRVAGFFDEPGTFAYFISFGLLINKLYGFSKKIEWMLILSGFFTLSLAFFITVFLYFILFYGSWKQIKYLIIGLVVMTGFLFYVNNTRYDSIANIYIYDLTLGRLEKTENSERIVDGDNRSELFKIAWDAFVDSPLIGQGIKYREDPQSPYFKVFFGANLFSPLGESGIIGLIIFFLPFFYWTYLIVSRLNKTNQSILISCWIIVFVNFLQRPDVRGFFTNFVLIFLIESTKYYQEQSANLNSSNSLKINQKR